MDWLAWARRGWIRLGGAVFLLLRVAVVAALLGAAGVSGQTGSSTVEDALHRMSDRAAVVFVGQVVAIRWVAGAVEVEFRVDQAVRGCGPGTYVLREWAGLWTANEARYRVGQRRLMLLHAPGAGRMSSPVDGLDGALPVYGLGSAGDAVDLRWVGTKLQKQVTYAAAPTVSAGGVLVTASSTIAQPSEASSVPAQAAGVAVVVGLLRGWSPEVSAQGER